MRSGTIGVCLCVCVCVFVCVMCERGLSKESEDTKVYSICAYIISQGMEPRLEREIVMSLVYVGCGSTFAEVETKERKLRPI